MLGSDRGSVMSWESQFTAHDLQPYSFTKPTNCSECSKTLWGSQLVCKVCRSYYVHTTCFKHSPLASCQKKANIITTVPIFNATFLILFSAFPSFWIISSCTCTCTCTFIWLTCTFKFKGTTVTLRTSVCRFW